MTILSENNCHFVITKLNANEEVGGKLGYPPSFFPSEVFYICVICCWLLAHESRDFFPS